MLVYVWSSLSGRLVEESLQLAFPLIDPTDTHGERILDLISVAETFVATDNVRALYFAHEALTLAESQGHPELELLALKLLIGLLTTGQRLNDATPFILLMCQVCCSP